MERQSRDTESKCRKEQERQEEGTRRETGWIMRELKKIAHKDKIEYIINSVSGHSWRFYKSQIENM